MPISIRADDFLAILPPLILAGWGMILLLVDLLIPPERKTTTAWLSLLGPAGALVAVLALWNRPLAGFQGMVILDPYALFLDLVFIVALALSVPVSLRYLKDRGIERGEYYSLLLFTTSGMMLMGAAADLIVVLIALELLSIPLYILSGLARPDPASEESALKYFLLGAFSSAFLVYGIALTYGATGTTGLSEIAVALGQGSPHPLLLAGVALLLVGFGFKVAAVPFHMWTPDVYEGAPTPVVGFMSVGAKAGGFAALLRIFLFALPGLSGQWAPALALIAALTMILGNVVAVAQQNIKRMLAYSSIAHAGYILMGLAAHNGQGLSAALFYLLSYAFTNVGAFAVVTAMARKEGEDLSFDQYAGLARRQPGLAAAFTLFMLSLTGIPPTSGFVGKYVLFGAAIGAGLYWLAIVGVLTSVISAFYYLRPVVRIYFDEPLRPLPQQIAPALAVALVVAALGVLGLGLWPAPWLEMAGRSVQSVMGLLAGL